MVKLLYKAGASVTRDDRKVSPLSLSIKYGNFFVPAYLLSLKEVIESLDVYTELHQTLIYAISLGSYEMFKLVIDITQPPSLEIAPGESVDFMNPNDPYLLETMNNDLNYSLLHYA